MTTANFGGHSLDVRFAGLGCWHLPTICTVHSPGLGFYHGVFLCSMDSVRILPPTTPRYNLFVSRRHNLFVSGRQLVPVNDYYEFGANGKGGWPAARLSRPRIRRPVLPCATMGVPPLGSMPVLPSGPTFATPIGFSSNGATSVLPRGATCQHTADCDETGTRAPQPSFVLVTLPLFRSFPTSLRCHRIGAQAFECSERLQGHRHETVAAAAGRCPAGLEAGLHFPKEAACRHQVKTAFR